MNNIYSFEKTSKEFYLACKIISFLFLMFLIHDPLSAQSSNPTLTCNWSQSNNISDCNNLLYPCVSNISATITYTDFPENTQINFNFPNSFHVDITGAISVDAPEAINDGQFYNINSIVSGSGSLNVNLQFLNCNSNGPEVINFNNLSFDCYAPSIGQNGLESEFTGQNLSIVPAPNTIFTYTYGGLPFEIISCNNCNTSLTAPGSITRSITIKVNAPQITNLLFSYSDEADVTESSFALNGNAIVNYIDLNGIQVDGNCDRIFSLTQDVDVQCENFSGIGSVNISLPCGECQPYSISNTLNASINLNNPNFYITNTLQQENNILDGCPGTYTNTYVFHNINHIPIKITNIQVPLNTGLYYILNTKVNGIVVDFIDTLTLIDVGYNDFTLVYELGLNCEYYKNCSHPVNYLNPESGEINISFQKNCTDTITSLNVDYTPILGLNYASTLLGGACMSSNKSGLLLREYFIIKSKLDLNFDFVI